MFTQYASSVMDSLHRLMKPTSYLPAINSYDIRTFSFCK